MVQRCQLSHIENHIVRGKDAIHKQLKHVWIGDKVICHKCIKIEGIKLFVRTNDLFQFCSGNMLIVSPRENSNIRLKTKLRYFLLDRLNRLLLRPIQIFSALLVFLAPVSPTARCNNLLEKSDKQFL